MDESLPQKIGLTIQKLRLAQARSQDDVAKQAGFTKSLLSKIESGKVTPPVATLIAIATALGTNVASLIEWNSNLKTVSSEPEDVERGLAKTQQGYWIYPFAASRSGKKMQPMFMVGNRGEVKEHHFQHEGEEFIYVVSGSMWVEVGKTRHRLETGGSIYFDSLEPHQIIPITETVKYLNIFL